MAKTPFNLTKTSPYLAKTPFSLTKTLPAITKTLPELNKKPTYPGRSPILFDFNVSVMNPSDGCEAHSKLCFLI